MLVKAFSITFIMIDGVHPLLFPMGSGYKFTGKSGVLKVSKGALVVMKAMNT